MGEWGKEEGGEEGEGRKRGREQIWNGGRGMKSRGFEGCS